MNISFLEPLLSRPCAKHAMAVTDRNSLIVGLAKISKGKKQTLRLNGRNSETKTDINYYGSKE